MNRLFFLLIVFFYMTTIGAQPIYQVPNAYVQPKFAMPIYFEDGNGYKDTLFVGFDSLAFYGSSSYTPSDTMFGCKEQFVDTSKFYVKWSSTIPCNNQLNCDSVYKINISQFTYCNPTLCFPSGPLIELHKGILPLKISWDINAFYSDSLPFSNQNNLPKAEGTLYINHPFYVSARENGVLLSCDNVLITDTVDFAPCRVRDSITIFSSFAGINVEQLFLSLSLRQWTGFWVSIHGVSNSIDFELFPNPTTDNLKLNFSERLSKIRLFSLDGREVYNFTFDGFKIVDVSSLPKGVYIIFAYSTARISQKRFIKY